MDYSMAQPSSSKMDANTDGNPISNEWIQNIMREHENDPSFTVKSLTTTKALEHGDNFIAQVFRVKIDAEIKTGDTKSDVTRSVIVKKPSLDEKNLPLEIFKYEPKFYNHVLEALEEAFGSELPVIRCINAEENIVITEDFQNDGWVLASRRDGLNNEECQKVVRSLAKIHAASIVLSNNEEIKFKKLEQYLKDQAYATSNEDVCKRTLADTYAVAKYIAEQTKSELLMYEAEAMVKFFAMSSDEMYEAAQKAAGETPDFAKVLIHGNCWANNIMLKDDNSGDEALLVNLATFCMSSPARDLIYLFATNPQTMDRKGLIQLYIDELHKHLIDRKVSNQLIQKFSVEFIESEFKRLEIMTRLTAIWLLVSISYVTYPSVEEYNNTKSEDKPALVANHIDIKFYKERLVEFFVEYAP